MNKEETPFEKKSCYDCVFLQSAVNWWCTNQEAIQVRGTAIPGCIHCTFWKPDWKMIEDKFKPKKIEPQIRFYLKASTRKLTYNNIWIKPVYIEKYYYEGHGSLQINRSNIYHLSIFSVLIQWFMNTLYCFRFHRFERPKFTIERKKVFIQKTIKTP